jgi:hypothetical protein
MKRLTCFEQAVVYPQQTVRGGEVLLIKDRDVMVLHSLVAEYHGIDAAYLPHSGAICKIEFVSLPHYRTHVGAGESDPRVRFTDRRTHLPYRQLSFSCSVSIRSNEVF